MPNPLEGLRNATGIGPSNLPREDMPYGSGLGQMKGEIPLGPGALKGLTELPLDVWRAMLNKASMKPPAPVADAGMEAFKKAQYDKYIRNFFGSK